MGIIRKLRSGWILLRSDRAALATYFGLRGNGKRARKYLNATGAEPYLVQGLPDEWGVDPLKAYDLANVHKIVRRLRPKVVVEFGCGFSSISMAHALAMNTQDGHPGEIHIVEASAKWADNVRTKLSPFPHAHVHTVRAELMHINGQLCHVSDVLPDVIPDFIYLDGPYPTDIHGSIHGLTCKTIAAADPVFYEWRLNPGFEMLIDGRFLNTEFLKANLQRKYSIRANPFRGTTLFRLIR